MVALLVFAGCGEKPSSTEPNPPATVETATEVDAAASSGTAIPLDDAEVFFEWNSTDNDLGFQVFLDGVGWNRMTITGPDNRKVLDIHAKSPLRTLGITELFFESAEPSPAEVLALFAPGEYLFMGRSAEGDRLYGEGELSHDLLSPAIFTPSSGETVDPDNVVISWDAVAGAESYQLIVENEDSGATISVDLPASVTSLTLPVEFMEAGAEYKAEVLAISEEGNKTITEGFFNTSD
jgi:hypothetical protein